MFEFWKKSALERVIWVMTNSSPGSLVVHAGKAVVLRCLAAQWLVWEENYTWYDASSAPCSPAWHYRDNDCFWWCLWSKPSLRGVVVCFLLLFSEVFCTACVPILHFFYTCPPCLANDNSTYRERAHVSGGPLSISWRRHIFYLCQLKKTFVTACKGTCEWSRPHTVACTVILDKDIALKHTKLSRKAGCISISLHFYYSNIHLLKVGIPYQMGFQLSAWIIKAPWFQIHFDGYGYAQNKRYTSFSGNLSIEFSPKQQEIIMFCCYCKKQTNKQRKTLRV